MDVATSNATGTPARLALRAGDGVIGDVPASKAMLVRRCSWKGPGTRGDPAVDARKEGRRTCSGDVAASCRGPPAPVCTTPPCSGEVLVETVTGRARASASMRSL